jgi:hypothetical protein
MAPKHRRPEIEPSLASICAPANTAEFWPEAVGNGQAAAAARPIAVQAGWRADDGYLGQNGYEGDAVDPGWATAPKGQAWRELQDWQGWEPPAAPHADHPAAPIRQIHFADGYPPEPVPALRAPTAPDRLPRRPEGSAGACSASAQTPDSDYYNGNGPATTRSQSRPSSNSNPTWTAGQAVTPADSQAAEVTQEAQEYAATIREAAEREAAAITKQATSQAAAIREAAERDAAERRAGLDSMSGELGRVAAYVTESLAGSALRATAPALPNGGSALSVARSAEPATTPAKPDIRPDSRLEKKPDTRLEKKPDTRSVGLVKQRTTPARKPQQRPRQVQAMRVAAFGTAALLSFAAISGATELGLHGYKFFVFRGGGVGQTPGNETDQQFLARQRADAQHAAAAKAGHRHGKAHQVVLSGKRL